MIVRYKYVIRGIEYDDVDDAFVSSIVYSMLMGVVFHILNTRNIMYFYGLVIYHNILKPNEIKKSFYIND